jgi:FtsZ-interacting cell division protein YlmF
VTVLGGAAPRATFNTAATDSLYRDPTPPHGTPGFTSSPETAELELFIATEYSQCQAICDILKARRPVIVNTAHCDRDTSRRIVAFICGFIYMMNGRIQPLVKGSVILAEPIRSITVSPTAIERFRLTGFER